MRNHSSILAAHAHRMRQAPTDSEAALWAALRSKQIGVEFRRQVPVLRFIVDFLAPRERLVVEIDGGYHARRQRADARRDQKLRRAGYRMLRVEAELVTRQLSEVLNRIRLAIER